MKEVHKIVLFSVFFCGIFLSLIELLHSLNIGVFLVNLLITFFITMVIGNITFEEREPDMHKTTRSFREITADISAIEQMMENRYE